MLTASTLGMVVYGFYSTVLGVVDLVGVWGLDWWADLGLIVLGLLLVLAAAFVRVLMPGGLALALGAMLALQALSFHNDFHFYGELNVVWQVVRGVFALVLVGLAFAGSRRGTPVGVREPGVDDQPSGRP